MNTRKRDDDTGTGPVAGDGRTPQHEQQRGENLQDANARHGRPANAGAKDGAPGGSDSRQGPTQPPARSGNRQVDLKPGSADAGVHGGAQPTDLTQGSQRQRAGAQGGKDPFDRGEC